MCSEWAKFSELPDQAKPVEITRHCRALCMHHQSAQPSAQTLSSLNTRCLVSSTAMIVPRFLIAAALAATAACAVVLPDDYASIERRDANGIKDPSYFPGGKNRYTKGWRVLPTVDGADIDNTTFKFGQYGANLTVYITQNMDKSKIKRAVIALHGDYRDAWNQFKFVNMSLQQAIKGGDVKNEEVAIVAPMFFSQKDQGAFPVDKKGVSNSPVLIWDTTTWGNGDDAIYPSFTKDGKLNNTNYKHLDGTYHDAKSASKSEKKSKTEKSQGSSAARKRRSLNVENDSESLQQGPHISPFDVIDRLIEYFLDRKQFPNVATVVVSGSSLGAQLNQRYLGLRKDANDARVQFGISSPGSFMYFDDNRVLGVGKCGGINDYKYGIDGQLPEYVNRNKVPADRDSIMKRYFNATTYYMVGAEDKATGDNACQAKVQGKDHVEKVTYWVRKILPNLDLGKYQTSGLSKDGIPNNNYFTSIQGVSHQAYGVYITAEGAQMLFIDDYFGEGQHAKGPRPLQPGAGNNDVLDNEGKVASAAIPNVSVSAAMSALLIAFSLFAVI